jgi:hypothetical protein
VCTVHIGSEPFWSSVQPRFIRAHIPNATLVAAVDDKLEGDFDFDHSEVMAGEHRDKLDQLARRVVRGMAITDDDILVFLDGDAFPIRALTPFIVEVLQEVPLAAICREENDEEYPHPSFCVTTVGFWKEVAGTWEVSSDPGAPTNELGGGRLRDLLRDRGVQWRRLLRSNAFDPHPVLFGIYEDLIYHHGAGFRRPVTALDRKMCAERISLDGSISRDDEYQSLLDVVAGQNQRMSNLFKRLIEHVPEFHRLLVLT